MIFTETKLKGAFSIELERQADERGFFARTWCQREFAEHHLNTRWVQGNVSFNAKRGTLRGMHYQADPYGESKLVRCTTGAVYDVIIDLRPASPTFKQWLAVELTGENHRMIYIPAGFAHGAQTLTDNCELFYQMGEFYQPDAARGVRWDDPAFGIEWPSAPPEGRIITPKDRAWPDFIG